MFRLFSFLNIQLCPQMGLILGVSWTGHVVSLTTFVTFCDLLSFRPAAQPQSVGLIAGTIATGILAVIICCLLVVVTLFYWKNKNKYDEEEIPNEIRFGFHLWPSFFGGRYCKPKAPVVSAETYNIVFMDVMDVLSLVKIIRDCLLKGDRIAPSLCFLLWSEKCVSPIVT